MRQEGGPEGFIYSADAVGCRNLVRSLRGSKVRVIYGVVWSDYSNVLFVLLPSRRVAYALDVYPKDYRWQYGTAFASEYDKFLARSARLSDFNAAGTWPLSLREYKSWRCETGHYIDADWPFCPF